MSENIDDLLNEAAKSGENGDILFTGINSQHMDIAAELIRDICSRADFMTYALLAPSFIHRSADGKIHYDREKHLKCFQIMEEDFNSQLTEGDDDMPPFPEPGPADGDDDEMDELTR